VTCSHQSAALLGAKPLRTCWRRAQARSSISRQKALAALTAFTPTFVCGSSGSSSSPAARSSSHWCTVSEAQGCTPSFSGGAPEESERPPWRHAFANAANSMQLCGQRLRERSGGCMRNERQRLHRRALCAQFCVHMAQTPSKLKDFSGACGHAWGCVCCWQKER